MSTSIPFSVTVEDAVARMVNMDYIPTGFTLMDMTAAFLEEAEVNHHNAKVDHLPADQIAALEIRIDVCRARHTLAQSLLGAIQNEIKNPEGIIETIDNNSGVDQHITFDSLSEWASINFGMGLNDQVNLYQDIKVSEPMQEDAKPWMIVNPKDPQPPTQPWYTPARFFARKLIIEDSTLLTKRDILAVKVVQSLTAVGIYKRGGKKKLDPGTVQKAFSNVLLG